MKRLKKTITDEDNEFSELIKEVIIALMGNEENPPENSRKLIIVAIIHFYFFHCQNINTEVQKHFKTIITKFFSENSPPKGTEDTFDYGFFGDLLFKTYALFVSSSLKLFFTHGMPIFEIINKKKEYAKEYPKRLISYSILMDIFVKNNYKSIIEDFQQLKQANVLVLPIDKALEIIIQDSISEKSIFLRGLLIKGILKILTINPGILKALGVDRQELLALMTLQWHNGNLRGASEFMLSTLQNLSFFFVSQSGRSDIILNDLVNGFLMLMETFFIIKKKKETFNCNLLKIDIRCKETMNALISSFITLTSSSKNINLGKIINYKSKEYV